MSTMPTALHHSVYVVRLLVLVRAGAAMLVHNLATSFLYLFTFSEHRKSFPSRVPCRAPYFLDTTAAFFATTLARQGRANQQWAAELVVVKYNPRHYNHSWAFKSTSPR